MPRTEGMLKNKVSDLETAFDDAIKLKLSDENAKCRTQELTALADPRNAQRR